MRLDRPRLEPLPESAWSPELREVLGRSNPAGGEAVLNIFSTLAHHPKLLKRWLVFGAHVLGGSTLPARERELLILRIGWLCRAEYEWAQHVVIAKGAGVSQEEIDRVVAGPDAPGWTELESAMLRAVDELHADAFIRDETWQRLSAELEPPQLLDLIFAVGQYNLVSMALNSLGVQLDPGLKGFEPKYRP